MAANAVKTVRCAIYTRKSTEPRAEPLLFSGRWCRDYAGHGAETWAPGKIADYNLSAMTVSRDPQKIVYFGQSSLFKSYGEVSVAWGQNLRFTGDYRVQVDFTRSGVVKLFKAMFGSVITIDMLEEYGLSVSDDLKKETLRRDKAR